MKLARLTVMIAAAVLVGGGFVASQLASLNGDSFNYATKVDQPAVRYLALLILVAAIVLSFVKDRDSEAS